MAQVEETFMRGGRERSLLRVEEEEGISSWMEEGQKSLSIMERGTKSFL
jgi:hypothetical protein